jgi:hypothetical protein
MAINQCIADSTASAMAASATRGATPAPRAPSSSRTILSSYAPTRASRITDAAIVHGRGLDRATTWARQKPSKTAARDQRLWAASPARLPDDKRRTDPPRDGRDTT